MARGTAEHSRIPRLPCVIPPIMRVGARVYLRRARSVFGSLRSSLPPRCTVPKTELLARTTPNPLTSTHPIIHPTTHSPVSIQIQMRLENEKYLRAHPELKMMMNRFLRDVLEKEPRDVTSFAAAFFTDPALRRKVIPDSVLDEAVSKE